MRPDADDTTLLSALLRAGRLTEPQRLALAFLRHPVGEGLGPKGADRPEPWARGLCRQAGAYHMIIMATARAQRLWQGEEFWDDKGLIAKVEEFVSADDLTTPQATSRAAIIAGLAASKPLLPWLWRRNGVRWVVESKTVMVHREAVNQAGRAWEQTTGYMRDDIVVTFPRSPADFVHSFVFACGLGNLEPAARKGFRRWRPQIEEVLQAWVVKQIRGTLVPSNEVRID